MWVIKVLQHSLTLTIYCKKGKFYRVNSAQMSPFCELLFRKKLCFKQFVDLWSCNHGQNWILQLQQILLPIFECHFSQFFNANFPFLPISLIWSLILNFDRKRGSSDCNSTNCTAPEKPSTEWFGNCRKFDEQEQQTRHWLCHQRFTNRAIISKRLKKTN